MTITTAIFDGHNDTLLNLYLNERGKGRSFFERSEIGHIDLPRARDGGFAGGFFAAFVPSVSRMEVVPTADGWEVPAAPAAEPEHARSMTWDLVRLLHHLEAESEAKLRVVHDADELAGCLDEGILAAVLHFEGAEAIDPDLEALEAFYAAGLRSLGPVWSRSNAFGHGVPFRFPHSPDTGPGLTDAGRELVRACNRLGIMLDVTHLNEKGFWDVARLSTAPLVATHSNAHALCPVTRNLTDRQLDAIKESDGMVGLVFDVGMLRADGHGDRDAPLSDVVRHLTYLVERVGIDRVGFGSDFDGCRVPTAVGDVSGLPNVIEALRAAGFDDASLRKIAHENWLRVLRATWVRPASTPMSTTLPTPAR